jgi:type II secretory pathway pseudopilin PulG
MTMTTMMETADKKAAGNQPSAVRPHRKTPQTAARAPQSGYSLISMMAMMALLAIAMMAVAPSVYQEVQREKEIEATRRGEEVAEAIRQYVNFHNGTKLPNSIDDLLEGLPQGTKKRQILRASAAIDPLSEDGKWQLIGVESKSMVNFARRVQNYNNGLLPSSENVHQAIVNKVGVFLTNLDTNSEGDRTGSTDETDDEGEITTDNTPFIGVVSQSKNQSIIAYYGIENHSKWIFTPLFRGSGTSVNNNTFRDRDRTRERPPRPNLP